MSTLIQNFLTNYHSAMIGISPMVDKWLLMQSPLPVISIILVYLYFILKLGPYLMSRRPPFELKWIMVLYNFYQVVFSTWFCVRVLNIKGFFNTLFSFQCHEQEALDPAFSESLWVGAWWYFFSKVIDLLDTVFFVLRKKQSQVSFLHVYHHSVMCLFSWGYLKYLPGEQGILLGFLNSFVHIIMYSYYMFAALGPQFQKYLWWKKYVTRLQLGQFWIMLVYLFTTVLFDCNVPRSLTYFFVGNVLIFLSLFYNFYNGAYTKSKAKSLNKKK